jgi:hypothetical protein
MPTKTKRPKSVVLQSTADTLLKQLSGYWSDLPTGELRSSIGALIPEVEALIGKLRGVFPTVDDSD